MNPLVGPQVKKYFFSEEERDNLVYRASIANSYHLQLELLEKKLSKDKLDKKEHLYLEGLKKQIETLKSLVMDDYESIVNVARLRCGVSDEVGFKLDQIDDQIRSFIVVKKDNNGPTSKA